MPFFFSECAENSPKCSSNKVEHYQIVDDSKSWSDARLYCQGLGRADLVVIDSEEELEFVRNLVAESTAKYWLGLSDTKEEGMFSLTII